MMVPGMQFGISTMAAAALGNTISDMLGIGSAWYVESFADRLGECSDYIFGKTICKSISSQNRLDLEFNSV